MKAKKNTEQTHKIISETKLPPIVTPNLRQMEIVTLPREVLKWIQGLDLTYSVRNVKKDFNNGFLIAQILSRYYPITNNEEQNYKAVQMHTIDNGFSMERRRDNWRQIQKFIERTGEINLKIDHFETFIKNENDEIIVFLIKLYQELTRKKVPVLEGKKIRTDVDDVNKSFLLKDNGEVEVMRKEIESEKRADELLSTITSNTNLGSKNTNVVMKGDVKPISSLPTQLDKTFKLKISEPKVWEKSTRIVRQVRQPSPTDDLKGRTRKDTDQHGRFNSLKQDEDIFNQKGQVNENPFETLNLALKNKVSFSFPEDYAKIQPMERFIVDMCRNIDEITTECVDLCLDRLNETVDEFYNLLSGKQVNEFVDCFLALFDAYVHVNEEDSHKFGVLHEGMLSFLHLSLKNKNDEMYYIFNHIFLQKIFEAIGNRAYQHKLTFLCELIFKILDPEDDQQVDFFKKFKDNIAEEEIMFECFAILHDKIGTYSENLIDGMLFYIINGLCNESARVRFFSLYILEKYVSMNINFFYNFQKKFEKFSQTEKDRENCLLIIKMVGYYCKYAILLKNKPKEQRRSTGSSVINEKNEDDTTMGAYFNELAVANRIIRNIITRFTGDHLFTLLFMTNIAEFILDNVELYRIFLVNLFNCNESILKYILYEEELDQNLRALYECTPFRVPVAISKHTDWSRHFLLKAFDGILNEKKATSMTDKEYDFVKFIIGQGLNPVYGEYWKNNFKFSKIVIRDIKVYDTVHRSFFILESFLLCENIQKHIFDEWYDDLATVFGEIQNDNNEKCKTVCVSTVQEWIQSSHVSSIVRDDLRKLLGIFQL